MNVCIVGHGMMGAWHLNALEGTGGVPHTLVGRRPESNRRVRARSHGFARWTTSLEEALADDAVDVVILATPSETHAESALLALESGRPVLVEIPLAMSLPDAERVVEEAATRGLPLGVVHPLRARPELDELRQRVENGTQQVRQDLGAMLATEEGAFLFEPVTDNMNAAIVAGWSERMDRTLEAIEGVGRAVHAHLKRLVVVVAAGFASGHDGFPFAWRNVQAN